MKKHLWRKFFYKWKQKTLKKIFFVGNKKRFLYIFIYCSTITGPLNVKTSFAKTSRNYDEIWSSERLETCHQQLIQQLLFIYHHHTYYGWSKTLMYILAMNVLLQKRFNCAGVSLNISKLFRRKIKESPTMLRIFLQLDTWRRHLEIIN